MARAASGLTVQVNELPKSFRLTTNDRDHQRQPKNSRANERSGCASNPKPDWQGILHGPGVDSLASQISSVLSRPVNFCVLSNLKEKLQFFRKKRIVIFQPQTKERIR